MSEVGPAGNSIWTVHDMDPLPSAPLEKDLTVQGNKTLTITLLEANLFSKIQFAPTY